MSYDNHEMYVLSPNDWDETVDIDGRSVEIEST